MGSQKLISDLEAMLGLAQELWPDVQCTYGELAWLSSTVPHGESEARLWFDGERVVGWGWLVDGEALEFQVRPGFGSLLGEILDWATPSIVYTVDHDADAIARIRAFGLKHDPGAPWFRWNQRSLGTVDEPRLPDGYTVRTIEQRDFGSRAAAHRSAFHPSRFLDHVYATVRATAAYRPDLDCVVEAPDGSIAAYALAWLDEANCVGELEPVGTHADHRRRGLARAVSLFALQRLRDEGATLALVACRGDDAYPIPCKLYESIGFRQMVRRVQYKRV